MDKGLKVKSTLSPLPPSCLGEPLSTEGQGPPRHRPSGEIPHGPQIAVLLSKSFPNPPMLPRLTPRKLMGNRRSGHPRPIRPNVSVLSLVGLNAN